MKGEKIKWGASFVIAFLRFYTYLEGSLRGSRLDMILSNLSDALNLPVNMVGAEAIDETV
ncbi:hypothetical protein [Coxiella endosymbiont of Ornithodoros amblus]|uniref:hypothetical protein n=1 Tax=Coxiella endosymbiont of Ornithodoros amblus TaxID=1656166 RepID=UPI00244E1190|nr:hypothetical protein [Coxiella endosymbiont of Ornithodoros amblus]